MKKVLLLTSALLATAGLTAQAPAKHSAAAAEQIAIRKYGIINEAGTPGQPSIPGPVQTFPQAKAGAAPTTFSWTAFTKSMNIFGVLNADQKVLTYDEDLDAVCFIVRRGPEYVANPDFNPTTQTGAYTGGILAFVTQDWGTTWDSTLLYIHQDNWARYPQGGIWNRKTAPYNNMSEAWAVAMGPITGQGAATWVGSYYASKNLGTFSNSPDAATGATIFVQNEQPPYHPGLHKVHFPSSGFHATEDGLVRGLGVIVNAPNPSGTPSNYGFRGARIIKGTFNSGVFAWTSDSISLALTSVPVQTLSNNLKNYYVWGGLADMAWSENGQIGYVWFLGSRTGATDHNVGMQPIVWKTSNGGGSWSEIPGIDFNDTIRYANVLNSVARAVVFPAGKSYLRVPSFAFGEDIGSVVDKNGKLHLVSTVMSTSVGMQFDAQNAMVAYGSQTFNAANTSDGIVYGWHYDGKIDPVIFDFATDGGTTGWDVAVVDTLRTETPESSAPTGPDIYGYDQNPWNVYMSGKQPIAARIQCSRDASGNFIVYCFSDSDPSTTFGFRRFNYMPDIRVRARHVDSARVSMERYNLTDDFNNPGVWHRAFLHHTSSKCKITASSTSLSYTVQLPVKVTNSNPLTQETVNTHHFCNAGMLFTYTGLDGGDIGINADYLTNNSKLFPNPARESTSLQLNLADNATVEISLYNVVGARLSTNNVPAFGGENSIPIELAGLSKGIYFVNVKVGESTATKKLIIE
jgi:hypothetical protein